MRSVAVIGALLCPLALSWPAAASEALSDRNVSGITLAANAKGEALVTYRSAGRIRRVLLWGAVNARHPQPGRRQVRFRHDYAGGWGKYRRLYWRTFRNECRPYSGPRLVGVVAACTAPDGSHWALQKWQRRLPLLGVRPWSAAQRSWEVHVSHWTGPLPALELYPNWTYGGRFVGVFGRLSYLGVPVHGFSSTSVGNPRDRYGRNVYVDTLNSVYGRGWRRETGILTHKPTGTFCHSFVPQRPPPGYPTRRTRPSGRGQAYRVTVMGPGVTPVLMTQIDGLGGFDAARDAELNAQFDRVMAGDRICARER